MEVSNREICLVLRALLQDKPDYDETPSGYILWKETQAALQKLSQFGEVDGD